MVSAMPPCMQAAGKVFGFVGTFVTVMDALVIALVSAFFTTAGTCIGARVPHCVLYVPMLTVRPRSAPAGVVVGGWPVRCTWRHRGLARWVKHREGCLTPLRTVACRPAAHPSATTPTAGGPSQNAGWPMYLCGSGAQHNKSGSPTGRVRALMTDGLFGALAIRSQPRRMAAGRRPGRRSGRCLLWCHWGQVSESCVVNTAAFLV